MITASREDQTFFCVLERDGEAGVEDPTAAVAPAVGKYCVIEIS
jgi:hypothetical protein